MPSVRDRITQLATYLVKQIRCSRTNVLLGRYASGPGSAQEITLGAGLEISNGGQLNTTGVGIVSDAAYSESTWNGATGVAPSKNAVRDKIESLAASIPAVDNTAVTAAIAEDPAKTKAALNLIGLSVKDYGATGDGSTDDTVFIQNALDAAGDTADHRTVYFPAGIYKITAALVIKQQGTTLLGDGQFSTTINQVTPSEHAITWDAPNNVQYTAIRHLSITGVGGDTSTGTGIYARSDTGPGNFFASGFTFEDVGVSGFQNGLWAQNAPKLLLEDSRFQNNQVGVRLTKADTFLIKNVGIGASSVTASTTGIIVENSTAPIIAGSNFGGIIQLGEFGDLNRFLDVTGNSVVTVIDVNVERCGDATTECAIYLAGTSRLNWIGGRMSNGTGDATMAYFRLYCDAGGDVPTLAILAAPKLDGGSIRHIESYGGLSAKSNISATGTAKLNIAYATTAGGAAYNTSISSPFSSYGGISSMVNTSAGRGTFGFIPGSGDGFSDLALVTAKDPAGNYARRSLINDSLVRVLYDTSTVATNTSTTPTTIFTTTVGTNTFTDTRQTVRVRAFGKFAANANNKRIQVDWGDAVAIYDSGSLAINDNDWELDIIIAYTAWGKFSAMVKMLCDDALLTNRLQVTKTINRFSSQNNIVNIVATGGATADVELLWSQTSWHKNDSEY